MRQRYQHKGFSLIELMIAVAVVGILSAIAYPSYVGYVQRSWRATAQTCLLEMTQTMERRFTANMAYAVVDTDGDGIDDLFQGGCSVADGMTERYRYLFTGAVSGSAYAVAAVPVGAQQGDACGNLGVNQFGSKTVTGQQAVQACW